MLEGELRDNWLPKDGHQPISKLKVSVKVDLAQLSNGFV
jgi:hypothetical protein